jgi:hypothetical protein
MRVLMVGYDCIGLPLGMDLLKHGRAVFGQTPNPPSRNRQRNVSCLALLPSPLAVLSDNLAHYTARYSDQWVVQRIFIVTGQPKDGWEGPKMGIHAVFPPKLADPQAAITGASPMQVPMHKGCTRDVQWVLKGLKRHQC